VSHCKDGAGWYYGQGWWACDPDLSDPEEHACREDAERVLLINYDKVLGPFDSVEDAWSDGEALLVDLAATTFNATGAR
jgi:hypothetical protein